MKKPEPNAVYTLRGQVVDTASQQPLSRIHIEAVEYDFGRSSNERVGASAASADDGRFAITFRQSETGERSEGVPEVFLLFYAEGGKLLLHQSGWVALKTSEHDYGTIAVPVISDAGCAVVGSGSGDVPKVRDPSDPAGTAKFHGSKTREIVAPRTPFPHGPFGRLFRELPPWSPPGASSDDKTRRLGEIAGLMLESVADSNAATGDNTNLPVGYTYFGQFVDHDVTFDPASSLQKQNDPERLQNFRTPRFDLDNLYGGGPDDAPYLFSRRPNCQGRFLVGKGRHQSGTDDLINMVKAPQTSEDDLPRNEQGLALIGDPRNDENIVVSQLQLVFLKFHNRAMDHVEQVEKLTGREAFDRARNLVRWHYQWVVLNDFLPRIVGRDMVGQVLRREANEDPASCSSHSSGSPYTLDLRFFKWKNSPYMPVEFSVAAYRFGHSMIRERYDLNGVVRGVPIFQPPSTQPGALADLRGNRPLPGLWTLDWRMFFEMNGSTPQKSRLINTQLSRALSKIPAGPGGENALAFLNLLRGWRMDLPSGQAVARAMGAVTVYDNEQLRLSSDFGTEAPLWYYLLKEAEIEAGGIHLGPVGGRIVAEVFVGLAKGDPNCFLNVDPRWTPATATIGGPLVPQEGQRLELRDIVGFAAGAR